jgi:hypothetical protein
MMRVASALAAAAWIGALLASGPSFAQASGCEESQKLLGARAEIMKQVNGLGKKQIDPNAACSAFTKLAGNGATLLKWLDTNKDWCAVPDDFVNRFKEDHKKVSTFRGKACQAAEKMAAMKKQAQQAQQAGGGGGLLGGPGLTGEYKLPKGAL